MDTLAAWASNELLRNFSESCPLEIIETGQKIRTDIGVDGDKNAEEDQEFDYVEWQQICRAQIFRAKSLHKIKYCVQQEPARQKLTLPRIYDSSDSPAKRY